MATKKWLSLEKLTEYTVKIKALITSGDTSTLNSAKSYADNKMATLTSGTTTVKKAEEATHAASATTATNATNAVNAEKADHATTADTATNATNAVNAEKATNATNATKATQDASGNVITTTYETKSDASAKLAEAKTYAEGLVKDKSDKGHGHDVATTTAAGFMSAAMVTKLNGITDSADSVSFTRSLTSGTKVGTITINGTGTDLYAPTDTNTTYTFATGDSNGQIKVTPSGGTAQNVSVKGLGSAAYTATTAYDAAGTAQTKADTAETNAKAYTDEKIGLLMNNSSTAVDSIMELVTVMEENDEVVSALDEAIGTKANASDLTAHTGNTTVHITSTERTNWNAAKTHADSTHAPSNAQANVIESVKVNGTTQTISSKAVNITVPTKASDISAAPSSHVGDSSHITGTERTNWNTAYSHSTSAHAPSNAQANVIESIKVNGTAQTISSKAVNITVPTKASDISAAPSSHVGDATHITSTERTKWDTASTTAATNTAAITANTNSITSHTTAISNLQTAVGEFEEITSDEITALFA